MARSKRERYRSERKRIEIESSEYTQAELDEMGVNPREISDRDRELLLEFLDAKDPQSTIVTDPGGSTKSDSTLSRYANLLGRVASVDGFTLDDATPNEINRLMDAHRTGDVDGVKDNGLSEGTVKNFQSVLRKFYEYHSDLGVEKGEIALFNPDTGSVDERDIFGKEEIHSIRDAAQHPRDKALVDLLFYTGQRLSAVLNLRLKDVDPENGVFYLNEDAGDLKGASGKRPLLYAEKAVRTWKNQHPCDDPEAHFITHKYDFQNRDYGAGERLDNSTVYRQLQRIGDSAGVDKPMNAHNFRHTFVTICKRNYGMDNDTIKRLIGHRPDSNIMESTYAHLTDDDVIAAAERATDIRDDEPESPLTPEVCDVCGERIERPDAKACPGCGTVFTPDAKAAEEQIEQGLKEDYRDTDPEDSDTMDKIDALDELLEDPDVKAVLLDKLSDE